MSTALATLTKKLAAQFDMGDGRELTDTLKSTAFKSGNNQPVTDAQMTALLVVASQYGLNPFTKEIFAFPDKGGIVPVVGVDGWARIINSHPQFDGMDFEQDAESCTCRIYRKDRSHPTSVTEYMSECKRSTGPWQSHPRRMLRHKAMIQAARLAFGYGGIYDQDEAERIVERDMGAAERVTEPERPALESYPNERFAEKFPAWRDAIQSGKKSAEDVISMVSSRAILSDEQKREIRACEANQETGEVIDDDWEQNYAKASGDE